MKKINNRFEHLVPYLEGLVNQSRDVFCVLELTSLLLYTTAVFYLAEGTEKNNKLNINL